MSSKNRIDEIIKALDWIANETEFVFAADTLREAANIIRDGIPAVRGEWIAEQKNAEYCEFRCSECGESAGETDQFDETELKQFSEWYEFCPNCGAKMEETT